MKNISWGWKENLKGIIFLNFTILLFFKKKIFLCTLLTRCNSGISKFCHQNLTPISNIDNPVHQLKTYVFSGDEKYRCLTLR